MPTGYCMDGNRLSVGLMEHCKFLQNMLYMV